MCFPLIPLLTFNTHPHPPPTPLIHRIKRLPLSFNFHKFRSNDEAAIRRRRNRLGQFHRRRSCEEDEEGDVRVGGREEVTDEEAI